MRKGVEHIINDDFGALYDIIYTSLMPKGVEHQSLLSGAKGAAKIQISLMPKGVEHKASIVRDSKLGSFILL